MQGNEAHEMRSLVHAIMVQKQRQFLARVRLRFKVVRKGGCLVLLCNKGSSLNACVFASLHVCVCVFVCLHV